MSGFPSRNIAHLGGICSRPPGCSGGILTIAAAVQRPCRRRLREFSKPDIVIGIMPTTAKQHADRPARGSVSPTTAGHSGAARREPVPAPPVVSRNRSISGVFHLGHTFVGNTRRSKSPLKRQSHASQIAIVIILTVRCDGLQRTPRIRFATHRNVLGSVRRMALV